MSVKTDKQTPELNLIETKGMSSVHSPVAQPPPSTFARATRAWFLASALYDGVEDEDLKQIKTLLEDKGADPNILLPEYGIAPFHLIVGNPCKPFALKATRLCLLAGANPNVRSEDGLTPVHVTAIWGRVEVLELLLKNGGDPWLVDDEQKMNAFQYAQQENQWGAFNLMSTFCGLDNAKDHQQEILSPSPCTLELKRVLVYKNDLCVEYEAESMEKNSKSNRKLISVETMTSPRLSNNKSISVQTMTSPHLQHKNSKPISKSQDEENQPYKECTCPDDSAEFDWCGEQSEFQPNNRAVQIIKDHRKKTIVYESVPTKTSSSEFEFNTPQASWRKSNYYNNTDFKLNLVTELRNKLDHTNKLRLFSEAINHNDPNLGKVAYRKSKSQYKSSVTEAMNNFEKPDVHGDNVLNKNPSKQNVGFVSDDEQLNTEYATSDVGSQCNPSDIGFKIEFLPDEMNLGFIQDPNSLISDISSDIDIDTMPQTVAQLENIMTEDECQQEIRVSSSTSNPYVTCSEDHSLRNTDNDELNFTANVSEMVISGFTPSDSIVDDAEKKEEFNNLISEDNSINDDQQRPTTSTSDILCEDAQQEGDSVCSTHAVSGSPCGELGKEYDRQLSSKKWVEAHIPYTSDEEEQEMSISEEYKYTDTEEGIVLIEKRYLFDDVSIPVTAGSKEAASKNDKQNQQMSSEESDISSLSRSTAAYDTDALKKELQEKGFTTGPITGNTKRVYLRKLKRFRRKPPPVPEVNIPSYTCELSRTLTAVNLKQLLTDWRHLEQDMCSVFESADPNARWREGFAKTSFTYLLLDPRITRNLPSRAMSLPSNEVWSDFLQSIFYIGKGKRSRPYCHLYQAVATWDNKKEDKSAKVERILEIWRLGLGVVCLHIFQNIIPAEAYTREAAMISALSLPRLTNEKTGEFYGPAASWLQRQKRQLGVVLLHRACQMFLAEGERQLRPGDID